MPPRRWALPPQHDFLIARKAEYIEAQAMNSLPRFRAQLESDFIRQWPVTVTDEELNGVDPDLVEERRKELLIKKTKRLQKRLTEWYQNHGKEKGRPKNAKQLLGSLFRTKRRSMQAVELYSRKHYIERIRPQVLRECQEKGIKRNGVLEVIKRLTRETWLSEDADFRADIEEELEELKASLLQKGNARSASDYSDAISALSTLLKVLFDEVSETSGWFFSVVCGGPTPEEGGKVTATSFHTGSNLLGQSYAQFLGPQRLNSWSEPFREFLRGSFTAETCNSRALSGPLPEAKEDTIGEATAGELVALTFVTPPLESEPSSSSGICPSEPTSHSPPLVSSGVSPSKPTSQSPPLISAAPSTSPGEFCTGDDANAWMDDLLTIPSHETISSPTTVASTRNPGVNGAPSPDVNGVSSPDVNGAPSPDVDVNGVPPVSMWPIDPSLGLDSSVAPSAAPAVPLAQVAAPQNVPPAQDVITVFTGEAPPGHVVVSSNPAAPATLVAGTNQNTPHNLASLPPPLIDLPLQNATRGRGCGRGRGHGRRGNAVPATTTTDENSCSGSDEPTELATTTTNNSSLPGGDEPTTLPSGKKRRQPAPEDPKESTPPRRSRKPPPTREVMSLMEKRQLKEQNTVVPSPPPKKRCKKT